MADEDIEKTDSKSRRQFVRNSLLTVLGSELVSWQYLALGKESPGLPPSKKELRLLNSRPLNAEAMPHLLDDQITPASRMFVRNNGIMPEINKAQDDWVIKIDGSVDRELSLRIGDLRKKFQVISAQVVLECGGNGRAGFRPRVRGNQWTFGAVGCPLWEGVRLKDVLKYAGVKSSAVYLAYYSHDNHLSGDPEKDAISRGFPIEKAMEDWSMIVFGMNGKPLSREHGFPARLICPGFPGSASGKWLQRLYIRDKVHDGAKMGGYSYRVPEFPVRPGEKVAKEHMKIIHEMPVKSLITWPESGEQFLMSKKYLEPRGFAWSGSGPVTSVDVSFNFGQSWIQAKLEKPVNPFAWQRWSAAVKIPVRGYYEVWARATDATGRQQPMLVPGWNPRGYLNNAMARIAVQAV